MGSTNSTTNLQLPQFIGTDKPSWLGDFNGAMLKVDNFAGTATSDIGTVTTTANAAKATAEAAEAAVGALETTVTQHTTEISDTMADISALEADITGINQQIADLQGGLISPITMPNMQRYTAGIWANSTNAGAIFKLGNIYICIIPGSNFSSTGPASGVVNAYFRFTGNPLNLPSQAIPYNTSLQSNAVNVCNIPAFVDSNCKNATITAAYNSSDNNTYFFTNISTAPSQYVIMGAFACALDTTYIVRPNLWIPN